jgi:exopolysaccharide biosynthesis polyprenyl glycosylphosphotransferase
MRTSTASEKLMDELSVSVGVQVQKPLVGANLQWRIFLIFIMLSDGIMAGLALLLAYLIRFELKLPVFLLHVRPTFDYYQSISFWLILLFILAYGLHGLYARQNLLGGTLEYAKVFRASTSAILSVIVIGFVDPDLILARGWLFSSWFLVFLLVCVGRFTLRRVVYAMRRRGYFLTPAIIIGVNEEARSLAEQLVSWRTSGLHIVGFLDNHVPQNKEVFRGLCTLGKIEQLDKLIAQYDIGELIIATSALSRQDIVNLFQRYGFRKELSLRLSSGLFEMITTGLEVKAIGTAPLVGIHQLRMTGTDRMLKLMLDYAITIPALILITPLVLLLAIAVKLDSPGPIFYRRRVLGLHGRQFDAFKFRTMHMNGDEILARYPKLQEALARHHKLQNDPRVTRVGHFLRQSSLDELPQLVNILLRQMSLVGPRIITTAEVEKYDQWNMNLLTVYPGISGLWQVSGRSDLTYEERVRLDMLYVRNWTIWMDLQILLQTIPAVLRRRGAY